MDDQATSWIHSYPSHEEPLVSSKGREDLNEDGGSYLSADGSKSKSHLSSKSKELQQELETFMENVGKSADQKQELKKGFYTGGAEDLLPRHHIDEDDFRRHRTTSFPHVHHPLRIHTRPLPIKRERLSPSPRSKSKAKKSAEFTPSLPELKENNSSAKLAEASEDEPDDSEGNEAEREEVDDTDPVAQAKGDAITTETKPDIVPTEKSDTEETSTPTGVFEPPLASTAKKEGEGDSIDGVKPGFFIGDHPGEEQPDSIAEMPVTDPGQFNPGFMDETLGDEGDIQRRGSSTKVSFHLGPKGSDESIPPTASTSDSTAAEKSSRTKPPSPFTVTYSGKPHHHHHKHKHRRHSKASTKDLIDRRHLGSEVQLNEGLRRIPTETEEAAMLSGLDLDEMSSHRFGEARGLRRRKHSTHSAMASIVHISKSDKGLVDKAPPVTPSKAKFDHSPHELFVELDELFLGENAEFEWKEKSRWIKFEEDVEEGAERWGKPHVASLSFHSLLELRKCIEQGSILLDLEADDLSGIVTRITEQLVMDDLLNPESQGKVIATLLLKHTHVSGGQGFLRRNFSATNLPKIERNSSTGSFKSASFFLRRASSPSESHRAEIRRSNSLPESNGKKEIIDVISSRGEIKIEIDGVPNSHPPQNHPEEVTFSKTSGTMPHVPTAPNLHQSASRETHDILKKIPEGAEATTVLVGSTDFLEKPIMAFVRLSEGRNLGNLTEVPLPVRFIFILMGPNESNLDYHEIGRSISTLLANTRFHDVAYRADGRQDLLSGINEFLDDSLVMPPGYWDKSTLLPAMQLVREKEREKQKRRQELEAKKVGRVRFQVVREDDEYDYLRFQKLHKKHHRWNTGGARGPGPPDDPLKRTGRPFGGMINDIKRRYPQYLSDIKDALNTQCLATVFFIYFAALSPAITFGGLLGEKTEKYIGVSEMLIGVSASGILFSLLGAQPILIIGFTGPILVFEESLYQFCKDVDLSFMPFRCWVCFWLAIISVVVVALEGSFLVRYFSRFTEEIFASLISIIFIYEVFKKLYVIFENHPLQDKYLDEPVGNSSILSNNNSTNSTDTDEDQSIKNQPNTALLSLILTFGTFLLAYALKGFRNSQFLGRSVRRAIGDFGIPIAIFVMVLVDVLIEETYTEKLDVPEGLSPTDAEKRGWFINPMGDGLPVWAAFAAVIPAFLVFILIFMETEITSLIVNKAERKMKKGTGYHLDMFLIGSFEIFCGLLGLPMLCAATVRSVTHVSALTVFSKNVAPGEKPKLEGVLEQRVTSFLVHILIGVSVLMGPILKHVPLPVLFGVFLYMGVASMSGIQFFERVELFFKPVKHHPDVGYVRRVRTFKMHLFTAIQIVCLGILWAIKSTQAALSFPFALILTVPLRKFGLPLLFTEKELTQLDKGDEESELDLAELDEGEPDFYTQAHMPY